MSAFTGISVRTGVGLMETSGYGRYEVTGPDAEAFLESLLANRMPEIGRIVLAPMLNAKGKLIGDFTVGRHLRDVLSAPLMINNDRILTNIATASLMSAVPSSLRD